MLKHLWLALSAAALLVLSSGCGDDSCDTTADCVTKKGEDYVCNLRHTCVVKPTCSPGCSGSTPVCEPDSLTCKACTATEGCSGATPVCNTAANSGAGQCITCTATAGCGTGSVCDTTVAGGRCVQCLANTHCGGSTPICDVSSKSCKSCLATNNAGCSGATPVCNTAANNGAGQCITCSATAGCSAPTGTCDTSVAGGQCVGCLSDANCTGGAVCETSTKTCKTCTATAGCAQGTICDVAAANGAGQCVQCLDSSQCGGSTPVCDTTSKTCKSCLADNAGCSGSTPVCAAAANGGLGQCITCSATAGCGPGSVCDTSVAGGRCVQCVSNAQCGGGTPVCDTTSNTCKTCLSAGNAGCSGATPVCVPAGNGGQGQCITCTATQGCGSGTVCDTSVVGGQCVQCLSNTQCANTSSGSVSTPVCDTGTKTCKACVGGSNAGCGGTTPVCNATGNSGFGQCVTCVGGSNAGCGGNRPVCDTSVAGGQCVACVNNSTCGGSAPVCDTTSKTCKTCLASGAGCGGSTPVCDTAANSGGGQCVQCLSNASCASGVCDTGRKVCVECLGNNNCQDASRPYCNTTSNTCKSCLADSAGGLNDTGCSSPTSACDVTANNGNGACVVCTGSRGCSGALPTCDTTVPGGECVACTTDAQCANLPMTPLCDQDTNRCVQCRTNNGSGMAEGCSAGAPFCESGTNTCKTCLTSDNSGCTAPGAPACNASGNNGLGACVQCTGNTYCSSASATQCNLSTYTCQACLASGAGCSGGTPVCDVSVPVCVECVNSTQCGGTRPLCNTDTKSCRTCLADNSGCSGGAPFCDVQADSCATCVTNSHCAQPTGVCDRSVAGGQCVECTDNSTCSGSTPLCNTTTKSCKTCLANNSGCSGSTPVCNTGAAGGAGACVTCVAGTNQGCSGSTAVCDVSTVPGGQCVQCLSDANCGGSTPKCDTGTKTCKACLANNAGCSGATPICNTGGNGGAGQCVVCSAANNAGCGGATPICIGGTQCVQCTSNANCTAVQQCNLATNACENLNVASTSQQIADVRAAPDGTAGLALPINGALVTYKKPLTASEVGFFVQAEQQGPAIFVAVDPATLSPVPNVGDRVNLTVDQVTTATGVKQVTALSAFSVVSTGNNVAGLRQDLTNANDLIVTGLTQTHYQSELIRMNTVTLTSTISTSGAGHSQANISTPGYPNGDANLRIRLPTTLVTSLDLVQTCVININNGVMWQFIGGTNGSTNNTQPSAYSASDLTVVSCPAPTVVSAAALSPTQVRITFDRNIAPSSVLANGSQFTFSPALTASAATVSGKTVTVTTSAQAGGTSYTVTVANTVTDTAGGALGGTRTATFFGYQVPAVLRINEVQPTMTNSADLVELRVVSGGSTNGMTLWQDIASPLLLATLPNVNVAAGDIIVVHLRAAVAPGAAPSSETTAKNQHPMATYGANYDTAWDFHSESTTNAITFSNRILLIKDAAGATQDGVPFARSGTSNTAFPGDLQALISAGHWGPACPGSCAILDAQSISVEWGGLPASGATQTSPTMSRSGPDTNTKGDWTQTDTNSLGSP